LTIDRGEENANKQSSSRAAHSLALAFLFTALYIRSPLTPGPGLIGLLCCSSKPEVTERKASMNMKSGEHWHCTNPGCHCEVLVQSSGQIEGSNPRCTCGSLMKKKYAPPHLRYLEFLQVEESGAPQLASRED
jgi:hypothetical protein